MSGTGDSSLSRFGYAQELARAVGGFSSFALSFSIISVLTGITSTYGDALRGGGPAGLGLGWPLVSVGTLVVALAMAELASAFPTAGALYHWSALLGGRGWGWLTAMMNLVGQIAIVGAIDLVCAQTLVRTVELPEAWTYPIFAAILASHATLNIFSVKVIGWLNDFSATVHIVGVVALVALLLAFGHARPVSYLVETGTTDRPDGVYGLGFVNALVLGMWTFTGFDASAHVSEETRDPARRAPWGIVSAVAISAVAGYALVAALTLAIPSLEAAMESKETALFVLRSALGRGWGSAAMGLAILAMWFCGLSSVTSASRMLFAFARDGGVPMADRLRRVSARWKTPYVATFVSVLAPLALILGIAPIGDEVFNAVAVLATTGLYVSYGIPIALGVRARLRGTWKKRGPWHLGRAGVAVACVAVLWSAAVLAVCIFANGLSGILLAGIAIALGLAWALWVRQRFEGPKVTLATIEA